MRGTVLDVGFGTGISREFYPAGVRVVGIDASRGMLEVARRSRANADLLVMDAERLAFADQSFDSVAFNLCLCTIPDPERAVREGVRVARAGAPMVFLDHFNRRTVDVVRRAGVEVLSVERWLLGVFNLIVGRAPAG